MNILDFIEKVDALVFNGSSYLKNGLNVLIENM